jgi:3-hydroxyisobutyrate dehydrogenase
MTDTKKTDTKAPVTFIGLGMMGAHMAGHILSAGHPLHVYNRTRARAEALIARGATWHDDAGGAASQAGVVITMVGLPRDVEQIYLGEAGILARAAAGVILVDMTTSSPSLAMRIAAGSRR